MRMIDADEVIKFYANFINEHGFDPKDARFSIRDIEMNLWNIPTVEPTVNKWIPCSERLPKESERDFIVSVAKEYRWLGYSVILVRESSVLINGYKDGFYEAWQKIPKPYEVKEE